MFRAGRTSPITLARRSASSAVSPKAYRTLRPRSITSKDRVKPRWPLKFVRTCSPTDRTLRRDGPWSAARLGGNRYRFTNTSGGRLAMITLAPYGATQVEVEDSPEPHTVPAPVDAGDQFRRGGSWKGYAYHCHRNAVDDVRLLGLRAGLTRGRAISAQSALCAGDAGAQRLSPRAVPVASTRRSRPRRHSLALNVKLHGYCTRTAKHS